MKLTTNQKELLECLTDKFVKLAIISDKYALLKHKKYSSSKNGKDWKSSVCNMLDSFIKKGIVIYKMGGFYKLNKELKYEI